MTMRNSLLTVLGSVMLLGAALPAHSESVLRASCLPPCATGWWTSTSI